MLGGILSAAPALWAKIDAKTADAKISANGHRNDLRRVRQAADVRDFVNGAAGSQRLFVHGLLEAGADSEFVEHQIAELKPDSWKAYAADAGPADAKNGSRSLRMTTSGSRTRRTKPSPDVCPKSPRRTPA